MCSFFNMYILQIYHVVIDIFYYIYIYIYIYIKHDSLFFMLIYILYVFSLYDT